MIIHPCPDDEEQLPGKDNNPPSFLNPAFRVDSDIQDSIEQSHSPERPSSAVSAHSPVLQSIFQSFVNPAFEGDNDIQDGIEQGPSPERPPSAVSVHSTVSKSSSHSNGSSHSHGSDGKKPDRPRSRLDHSNIVVTDEKWAVSTMHAGSSDSLKDHVEVGQSPGSNKEKASDDIDSPVTTQNWAETAMPTGSSGSLKDEVEADDDGEDRWIFQKKSPSSHKKASCDIEVLIFCNC